MKIIVIGNFAPSLIPFRGALLAEFAASGHEVIVCAPGENHEVAREMRFIGVKYKALQLDRTGVNPFKDCASFVQLLFLLYRERPDLILNYTIKPVIYGSLAAKLAGIARVYSIITGLGYIFIGNSFKQRVLRAAVSWLYRKALAINNAVFFLNSDDLDLFKGLKLVQPPLETVLIHGEGVDLDFYTKSQPLAPSQSMSGQVFLLIARLIKDKGIHEFVAAARILKNKYPGTLFQIVGPVDSNPTAIDPNEIKQWQQEGVIDYLGETRDVRPFIADSSVYVLPSYREGLPRTVLEAMAMGRPVVTTDAPGCRDTVVDGDNGYLVPVKDADALARAMEKFILNPELIATMGKRSREIAESKFDVRIINALIIKTMGLARVEAG